MDIMQINIENSRQVFNEKHNRASLFISFIEQLIDKCEEREYEKFPGYTFYIKDRKLIFFKHIEGFSGFRLKKDICFDRNGFYNIYRILYLTEDLTGANHFLDKILSQHIKTQGFQYAEVDMHVYRDKEQHIELQERLRLWKKLSPFKITIK